MTSITILEALTNSVGYKIPAEAIETIAIRRDIDTAAEFTAEVSRSHSYRLCEADLLKYMVTVPDVTEGGVSVCMREKSLLVTTADSIYAECGEPLIGTVPAAPIDPAI